MTTISGHYETRAFSVTGPTVKIHFLISSGIKLLTPNNLGGTYLFTGHSKHKCCLCNHALQIHIYLLTYLLS